MYKVTKLLILIAVSLLINCRRNQNSNLRDVHPKHPEIFYNHSPRGLNLRATPELTGKIVKLIPYGEKIDEVVLVGKPVTVANILGNWNLIRHKGAEGWAFSGYLKNSQPWKLDSEFITLYLRFCPDMGNWFECARERIEKHQLRMTSNQIFQRTGNTLVFTAKSGKRIEFTDLVGGEWANTKRYALQSQNDGFAILNEFYYEGSGSTFIHIPSGDQVTIHSDPIFSPSKSRFITYMIDHSGYASHGMNITSYKESGLLTEFSENLPEFNVFSAKWLSDERIEIIYSENIEAGSKKKTFMQFNDGRWKIY